MNYLKSIIRQELENHLDLLKVVNDRLKKAPKGSVISSKNKRGIQYVHYLGKTNDQKTQRKYINNTDIELIKKLLQKSYDKKIKKTLEENIKRYTIIDKNLDFKNIDDIYDNLKNKEKDMIKPIKDTYNSKLEKWKEISYNGKGFSQGSLEIFTKNGERVRSKSEKILADMFYDNGIIYKYEFPLYLKGYGNIYPDFTFISKKSKKEIYWEHFGMMDDGIYSNAAIKKIEMYQRNGIFIGENLLITFESANVGLDFNMVQKFIEKYLI